MAFTEPDDNEETDEPRGMREVRAAEERASKRASEAEARAEAAERRAAFLEAGVDTTSKLGQMFANAYAGELDTEAIKAEYAEIAPPAPSETEEVPVDETIESTTERQNLATGGQGDTGVAPAKPVRGREGTAVQAALAARENGATREDAQGVWFNTLVAAAANGDQSALVKPKQIIDNR